MIDSLKDLVTLEEAKTYLGRAVTDTGDDQVIEQAIKAASGLVTKAVGCKNSLLQQDYLKELCDGDGTKLCFTENWPIVRVYRVCIGRDYGLRVSYNGTGATAQASVSAEGTGTLTLTAAEGGTWKNTDFPLSDYATVSDLSAAINASAGWTSSCTTAAPNWPAIDLMAQPGKIAKNASVDFMTPQPCERDYEIKDPDHGVLYSPYGWGLGLRNDWGLLYRNDWDPGYGVAWNPGYRSAWYPGYRDICINYRAGWTRDALPEPIRSACLETMLQLMRQARRDPGLSSEKIGQYSWTAAQVDKAWQGLMLLADQKLAPYRRALIRGWG